MRIPRRSPIRSLRAAAHKAAGWCLLGLAVHERARREFERVLELRGDDFGAYVCLARIAYKLGDYPSWLRECGHARRTDPLGYARLKHPFELFDPLGGRHADGLRGLSRLLPHPAGGGCAGAGRARGGDRPSTADRLGHPDRLRNPDRPFDRDPGGADPAGHADPIVFGEFDDLADGGSPAGPGRPESGSPAHLRGVRPARGDDCASDAERARFAQLGPIGAAEIAAADLDALATRLADGPGAP